MSLDTNKDGPPEILVERRDAAVWITLNRPNAYNAITSAIMNLLITAFDDIARDKSIRAVAVTGAGKAFCAGADLKDVQEGMPGISPANSLVAFLERGNEVFARLESLPQPTIAVVNGVALAGGLELMLCCDFAIADAAARFGEGHAKFGQLPGGGATLRLPERIGRARAKYLAFTGDLIDAGTALDWGLVTSIASTNARREHADEIIAKICEKSPVGIRTMKRLMNDAQAQPRHTAIRAEISASGLHADTYDRNEGLKAFVEKRQPVFTGS